MTTFQGSEEKRTEILVELDLLAATLSSGQVEVPRESMLGLLGLLAMLMQGDLVDEDSYEPSHHFTELKKLTGIDGDYLLVVNAICKQLISFRIRNWQESYCFLRAFFAAIPVGVTLKGEWADYAGGYNQAVIMQGTPELPLDPQDLRYRLSRSFSEVRVRRLMAGVLAHMTYLTPVSEQLEANRELKQVVSN